MRHGRLRRLYGPGRGPPHRILPCAGRVLQRRCRDDDRRHWNGRSPACAASCLHPARRAAVRLLYTRSDPVRHCVAGGRPAIDRGNPRRNERQSLPLRGACQHCGRDCRGRWTMSGPSFRYVRATELADALSQGGRRGAIYLAGGTDLLPLWKAGLAAPEDMIDISRLPFADISYADNTLVLGAMARLSDLCVHLDVKTRHPLISDAVVASASAQVRNLATVGGNLLQRTRCPY